MMKISSPPISQWAHLSPAQYRIDAPGATYDKSRHVTNLTLAYIYYRI